MRPGVIIAIIIAVVVIAFGIYMVDFDVSGEAELPEVSVEGGEMPDVDADVGEIEVGTEERTVTVPDVDVTPPGDTDAETEVQN